MSGTLKESVKKAMRETGFVDDSAAPAWILLDPAVSVAVALVEKERARVEALIEAHNEHCEGGCKWSQRR